jgi:PAS domain-containing protein
MLSIVRDMTEQKRVKEAHWISEEKLRVALEVGQMDCWDWDIASNTVHWSMNPGSASGLIQGSFSASYETFLELVHPQDRTLVDQQIKRTLAEGTDYTIEFRVINAEGTLRWARIQGQVLYDEAGKPLGMTGISMDVTQARQTASLPNATQADSS